MVPRYYVMWMPDGKAAAAAFRVMPDLTDPAIWSWDKKAWVSDPAVVGHLVDGSDMDVVSPAACDAAIAARKL
jgi:hypothetical protein